MLVQFEWGDMIPALWCLFSFLSLALIDYLGVVDDDSTKQIRKFLIWIIEITKYSDWNLVNEKF